MQEKPRFFIFRVYYNVCIMQEQTIKLAEKKKWYEYLPSWLQHFDSLFYYFVFMLVLGVLFFATSLFVNYFTTPFTGDYSAQQISFYTNGYDDWWHFFTTGEFIFYDTNTFLGANNIGSNSFYYLLDPFFMPILLFPRQFIAQGMAIMTIFKMAGAGMTFYLYMRYMGASRRASKFSGIAYAFSGWTAWYLWFNHFTDITIVFPLMLLGVERILKDKKPWVLMLSICLMGFVNYFFCVCFTLCTFFYAMFRFFQRIRLFNWKDNLSFLGIGFVAFVVGLLMSCMAMIPSATVALTSSRAASSSYLGELKTALSTFDVKALFKLMTSWEGLSSDTYLQRDKARIYYFLIELIYPVMSDRGVPLAEYHNQYGSYDNVSGSLFCFIPFLLLFTPALIKSIREKRYAPIIGTAIFVTAILSPFFYYFFFGFTQPYSRWFLFPVACLIAFVGLYLDKFKEDDIWTLDVGAVVTLVLAILGGIFSNVIVKKYGTGDNDYFSERVPIIIVTIIMCAYIVAVYLTLRFLKKKPKLHVILTIIMSVEITAMGVFVIEGHGVSNYLSVNQGLDNNNSLHSLIRQTDKADKEYYRSYSSLAGSSAVNDGMRNGYNGTTFFHSLYNYNTDGIRNYELISTGSWSGTYVEKRIGLDTLLGVKYYYVEDDYFHYYGNDRVNTASEYFRYNVPFGYEDITNQYKVSKTSPFKVYKNTNNVNFALSYDQIYDKTTNPIGYEYLFMNAALINSSQYVSIQDAILNKYPSITKMPSNTSTYKTIYLTDYNGSVPTNTYGLTYYDIHSKVLEDGKYKNAISLSVPEMLDVGNGGYTASKKPIYPDEYTSFDYSRYIAVINVPTGTVNERYNANGMVYYLNINFDSKNRVDVYFVDTNDKVITFDNHSDTRYTTTWLSKNLRAFYISKPSDGSDAPHLKKIVLVSRNYKLDIGSSFYWDTYDNYLARLQKFLDNPITNIRYRANHFDFDTNFANERIIVTRLAYEDGFTIKMIDDNGNKKNLTPFATQGGFLSFVSGKGNCHYEVDFYPPGLALGSYLSAVGTFLFFSSAVAYAYMHMYLNKKYLFKDIYRHL